MKFLTVLMLVATPLVAQGNPPERPQPVRRTVETAFSIRLQQELGLDAQQGERLRSVLEEWGSSRREIEQEERELRRALRQQLRPGIAAEVATVSGLVERLLSNRVAYAESFQGEMQALEPVLSPVQRGQLLLLRDEILQRVRQLQDERKNDGVPVRIMEERRNRP